MIIFGIIQVVFSSGEVGWLSFLRDEVILWRSSIRARWCCRQKRFSWCWSCWMPVETSCCFLMLFYFSILLQAMTSRVGKMLGNMMDSGAMKVLINDPDITLITIITIIIMIILLLGCPHCIFDCVRQNQHSQLHLLSQQCHQDFPIWLENQSVTLVIYLYIYTCHSSNTNII